MISAYKCNNNILLLFQLSFLFHPFLKLNNNSTLVTKKGNVKELGMYNYVIQSSESYENETESRTIVPSRRSNYFIHKKFNLRFTHNPFIIALLQINFISPFKLQAKNIEFSHIPVFCWKMLNNKNPPLECCFLNAGRNFTVSCGVNARS